MNRDKPICKEVIEYLVADKEHRLNPKTLTFINPVEGNQEFKFILGKKAKAVSSTKASNSTKDIFDAFAFSKSGSNEFSLTSFSYILRNIKLKEEAKRKEKERFIER